jgi:hypothetical protein
VEQRTGIAHAYCGRTHAIECEGTVPPPHGPCHECRLDVRGKNHFEVPGHAACSLAIDHLSSFHATYTFICVAFVGFRDAPKQWRSTPNQAAFMTFAADNTRTMPSLRECGQSQLIAAKELSELAATSVGSVDALVCAMWTKMAANMIFAGALTPTWPHLCALSKCPWPLLLRPPRNTGARSRLQEVARQVGSALRALILA